MVYHKNYAAFELKYTMFLLPNNHETHEFFARFPLLFFPCIKLFTACAQIVDQLLRVVRERILKAMFTNNF